MHNSSNSNHPLDALVRLWHFSQNHHSSARAAAKLLLGLYNGRRFPFDLTDLRLFDAERLHDVLTVLQMDASPQKEVHCWLNEIFGRNDMGNRFEHMAYNLRLKGRCSKGNLAPLKP